MINKIKLKQGFTLIELILYIALVSIFISGAILFSWDIIYGRVKSDVGQEVNQNLRLAAKRISYEIRNASAINSVVASDLCLASSTAARNPTRIYVSSGRLHIAWGGGTANCTSMTSDLPLTSNLVTVSGLTFTDRSSGTNSYNIEYSFTVSSTATRKEWQKSQSYSSSAEMRSN